MFFGYIGLGAYCHGVGVTLNPPEHGYLPLTIFSLQTILYTIGPLRVTINYLQAMTNDNNVFMGRLIFTTITWIAIFLATGALPILITYVGTGWIFWYMAISCLSCYFFVTYFLPDLDFKVIVVNVLDNERSSSGSNINVQS